MPMANPRRPLPATTGTACSPAGKYSPAPVPSSTWAATTTANPSARAATTLPAGRRRQAGEHQGTGAEAAEHRSADEVGGGDRQRQQTERQAGLALGHAELGGDLRHHRRQRLLADGDAEIGQADEGEGAPARPRTRRRGGVPWLSRMHLGYCMQSVLHLDDRAVPSSSTLPAARACRRRCLRGLGPWRGGDDATREGVGRRWHGLGDGRRRPALLRRQALRHQRRPVHLSQRPLRHRRDAARHARRRRRHGVAHGSGVVAGDPPPRRTACRRWPRSSGPGARRGPTSRCSCARFPDSSELRICGRHATKAEELARRAHDAGPTVTAHSDPVAAVAGAHVVVTVTSASEPLFPATAIADDTLICAVGATKYDRTEIAPGARRPLRGGGVRRRHGIPNRVRRPHQCRGGRSIRLGRRHRVQRRRRRHGHRAASRRRTRTVRDAGRRDPGCRRVRPRLRATCPREPTSEGDHR